MKRLKMAFIKYKHVFESLAYGVAGLSIAIN